MHNHLPKFPNIFPIDLDKELGVYVPVTNTPANTPQIKLTKNTSRLFLKGPIPFDWLKKANALGGSTGIVATGLWLYVGLNNSKRFKVDSKLDHFSGVARQTRQNALQKLQRAGLVELGQKHGAYPIVEIITDT